MDYKNIVAVNNASDFQFLWLNPSYLLNDPGEYIND